jgi:hypothetical protein
VVCELNGSVECTCVEVRHDAPGEGACNEADIVNLNLNVAL